MFAAAINQIVAIINFHGTSASFQAFLQITFIVIHTGRIWRPGNRISMTSPAPPGKLLSSQLHTWCAKWRGTASDWKQLLSHTSFNKTGNISWRNTVHFTKKILSYIQFDYMICDFDTNVDINLWWNEWWIAWGFPIAHAYKLCRLCASLLVNIASLIHSRWHRNWGVYTLLYSAHCSNWGRCFSPGCNLCIGCM
jgi:hypothetical protein